MNFVYIFNPWQNYATKKLSKKQLKELIENLDAEIEPFFTKDELNELARETKFMQREGKIDGEIFFEVLDLK